MKEEDLKAFSIVIVYNNIEYVSRDKINEEFENGQIVDIPNGGPLIVDFDKDKQFQIAGRKIILQYNNISSFNNPCKEALKIIEAPRNSDIEAWGINFHRIINLAEYFDLSRKEVARNILAEKVFPQACKEINERLNVKTFSFTPKFRYKSNSKDDDYLSINLQPQNDTENLDFHLNCHFFNSKLPDVRDLKNKIKSKFNYYENVIDELFIE